MLILTIILAVNTYTAIDNSSKVFSIQNNCAYYIILKARSLGVSDLRLEIKGSWFETGCYLCAEVSFLQ